MMDIKLESSCQDVYIEYHDNRYSLNDHFRLLDEICVHAEKLSKMMHCDVIVLCKDYYSLDDEKKSDYVVWDLFSDGKSKFKNKVEQ